MVGRCRLTHNFCSRSHACFQLLKLIHDKLLSNFACFGFKCNLRHYNEARDTRRGGNGKAPCERKFRFSPNSAYSFTVHDASYHSVDGVGKAVGLRKTVRGTGVGIAEVQGCRSVRDVPRVVKHAHTAAAVARFVSSLTPPRTPTFVSQAPTQTPHNSSTPDVVFLFR